MQQKGQRALMACFGRFRTQNSSRATHAAATAPTSPPRTIFRSVSSCVRGLARAWLHLCMRARVHVCTFMPANALRRVEARTCSCTHAHTRTPTHAQTRLLLETHSLVLFEPRPSIALNCEHAKQGAGLCRVLVNQLDKEVARLCDIQSTISIDCQYSLEWNPSNLEPR